MKRFILVLVAAAALAVPAGALASTGVVLKVERGAHLIAVTRGSHVVLVHTSRHLAVGRRIALDARRLRNGTFAATRIRVLGKANRVRFEGMLLARATHRMTLSAGGAIVTVRSKDTPKAQPGSEIEVDANVGDGDLEDGQADVIAPTAPGGAIEGHVLALSASSVTIVSDEQELVIAVPTGVDLSTFAIGDEVLARFSQQPDGSLLLTSISSDENAQAADGQDGGGDGHDGGGDGGGGSDG